VRIPAYLIETATVYLLTYMDPYPSKK